MLTKAKSDHPDWGVFVIESVNSVRNVLPMAISMHRAFDKFAFYYDPEVRMWLLQCLSVIDARADPPHHSWFQLSERRNHRS